MSSFCMSVQLTRLTVRQRDSMERSVISELSAFEVPIPVAVMGSSPAMVTDDTKLMINVASPLIPHCLFRWYLCMPSVDSLTD